MTTGESAGPGLVLGPMLRYVSETEVTIWVETDRECQVEVLGRTTPTVRFDRPVTDAAGGARLATALEASLT